MIKQSKLQICPKKQSKGYGNDPMKGKCLQSMLI